MSYRELTVLITLIAYNAILILIGVLAERRTKDGEDYFLAGRRMGPFVASLSASASSSSAWTLLAVSGMAYKTGLAAIWLFPACVGGFCLNWYVLAPALQRLTHRTRALTTTEVLAGEAAPLRRAVSTLASLIILVSLLTYVASQYQGAGKSISATFEDRIGETASILVGAGVVMLYTLLGGFWAVSLTDTLQGLVMAATAVLLPLVALVHLGFDGLLDGMRAAGADYLSLNGASAGFVATVGLAAGLLGIGLGYPGQPHVVNRFMALRGGSREVAVARRVAIGWAVLIYGGMILLGLCARVLFPALPDGEKAFMVVANRMFHPVLSGIMVAAVLSAVMSTTDSQLLVAASAVAHDLNFGGRGHGSLLRRSRIVVFLLSLGAIAGALVGRKEIFDRVLFAWSSMGAAFGPLLLVTALRGPVSPRGTIASMLVGFSLSVGAYSLESPAGPRVFGAWGGVAERVVPFALSLAVAWTCSKKRDAT